MLIACKVLKIDLDELEARSFDDFLEKQHELIYERGGNEELRKVNLPELARQEHRHYEKRR